MEIARFMAQPPGRIARIVAGILIVALGLVAVGGIFGILIALIGLLPIAAGAMNFCLIAPLIGAPFSGNDVLE